ncbi:MAG: SpoIIE family protein phosphatase [Candidatus Acidiferrales bacterium]
MFNSLALLSLELAGTLAPEPVISFSRAEWRGEIMVLAAAGLLLSIALGALALYFFFRKSRDRALIYFGVFCVLYAVRMLAQSPAFRALFEVRPSFWVYLIWDITSVILLPALLFFYQLKAVVTQHFQRAILIVNGVAAVLGIAAALAGAKLTPLFTANTVLTLTTFAAIAVHLAIRRVRSGQRIAMSRDFRVVLVGFAVWFAFILHANLLGLGLVRGPNVEFIGFLVFVAALGYVAADRTFAKEEQLLAINKELEIARRIQASTLPQSVPQLAGLEIAARYLPMSAVAGDFYDFLVVDERHVGILIADVTGHGVPAALIASMLKVSFAGQAEHADNPARVLDGLNGALCGKFEEHFVTAAYVYVDLEQRVMRYAGAAHPALMMVSGATGDVREYEENGLMLGMFPEAAYTAVEISVAARDRCVLCTDGILEARTPAVEEFGKPRCEDFLKSQRSAEPGAAADALLASVMTFAGYSGERGQDDDMTLLVVDFK